jgi:hypothetical protein
MGTSDFLLVAVPAGCGLLISVGGSLMLAPSFEHRRAARVAFVLGGVLFWMTGVIWAANAGEAAMSIRLLISGIVGAASAMFTVWMLTLASTAQTNSSLSSKVLPMPNNDDSKHVIGHEIIGNNQGGAAVEIQSNGSPGQPSTGADLKTIIPPGQSGTGLKVIQNGPGTGLKVIQTGPGVGLRSTVIVGPENK